MKIYHSLAIFVFATMICFLKGQQTATKKVPKFNRLFANMSQDCLRENRVTPERVVGIYTLNTNDREAKCYVACMLLKFNMTNESGEYNEDELVKFMVKPGSKEIPASMKSVIENCQKGDEKNRCEKAVQFTKCINDHKDEMGFKNIKPTMAYQRRPTIPFGSRRRPFPVFRPGV